MKKLLVFAIFLFVLGAAFAVAQTNDTNETINETVNTTINLTNVTNTTTNTTINLTNTTNTTINVTNGTTNNTGNVSDDDEDDEDDDDDVKVIHTPRGAEVRLLQLQRSLNKNILKAERVIDFLESRNFTNESNRTATLTPIVEEMKDLLDEIKAYNTSNKTAEQLAKDFVAFKHQANDLAKTFREAVKDLLTPAERKRLKEAKEDDDDDLRERIKERMREYNAERLDKILGWLDTNREDFVERVRNGEITPDQIKKMIRDEFKGFDDSKRTNALRKLKTESEDEKELREKVIDEMKDSVRDRLEIKRDARGRITEIKKEAKERIEDKQKSRGRGSGEDD